MDSREVVQEPETDDEIKLPSWNFLWRRRVLKAGNQGFIFLGQIRWEKHNRSAELSKLFGVLHSIYERKHT